MARLQSTIGQLQKRIEYLQNEKESYDDQLMYDVIELEAQLKSKQTDIEKMLKIVNSVLILLEEGTRAQVVGQLKEIKSIRLKG